MRPRVVILNLEIFTDLTAAQIKAAVRNAIPGVRQVQANTVKKGK